MLDHGKGKGKAHAYEHARGDQGDVALQLRAYQDLEIEQVWQHLVPRPN